MNVMQNTELTEQDIANIEKQLEGDELMPTWLRAQMTETVRSFRARQAMCEAS